MTTSSIGKSVRPTAANRFVFDDLQVGTLMEQLDGAHGALSAEIELLARAKQDYDIAKSYLDERRTEITLGVAERLLAGEPKTAQAVIDRTVKAELAGDESYVQREQKVLEEKNDLDDVQGAHDSAKSHQRTLLAKAQLTAATLQFLGASKTARATALANLADL